MSARSIIPELTTFEVWFLTGSQGLYGEETLRQVAEQSQAVVAGLRAAHDIPVTVVWKPVLTGPPWNSAAQMGAPPALPLPGAPQIGPIWK